MSSGMLLNPPSQSNSCVRSSYSYGRIFSCLFSRIICMRGCISISFISSIDGMLSMPLSKNQSMCQCVRRRWSTTKTITIECSGDGVLPKPINNLQKSATAVKCDGDQNDGNKAVIPSSFQFSILFDLLPPLPIFSFPIDPLYKYHWFLDLHFLRIGQSMILSSFSFLLALPFEFELRLLLDFVHKNISLSPSYHV